jgi:hypothetical protein
MENRPADLSSVQHRRVRNDQPFSVQLSIEPWAEEVTMSPNGMFEVIAKGPQGDFLEVILGEHRITVCGWSGSVATVFRDGEMVLDCQIPAPRTPPRHSGDSSATQ